MTDEQRTSGGSSKSAIICIAIIAVATAYMARSTWLTWPDPVYDFGAQLVFPWQIASGWHLYTAIAYFNGPLSQYFNAAMFKLFGASVHTLMLVNGAIALAVIAMIFRLINRVSDSMTATAACLAFILLFAFSRYTGVGIGNYNWICPYTHEVTHGVALSLAMVLAIGTFLRTGLNRWLVVSSILLGLVFLTKAEVFVAAAAAFAVGLILRFRISGFRHAARDLLIASLPFAAVLLTAFTAIAWQSSSTVAMRALLGSWPWVFDRRIAQLQFYQQGLGTDQLAANLSHMLLIGAASLALLGGAVATGVVPRRLQPLAAILFLAELIVVLWQWRWSIQLARPWPVFVTVIAGISIIQSWRADSSDRTKSAQRAMLAMLALGLLGKMLFNARLWQYGFALAMPAAVVLVETVIAWLPALLTLRGFNGTRIRFAGILLVGTLTLSVYANQQSATAENIRVGSGADEFFAGQRGAEVDSACREIDALIPPTGTLAVMPQGLMLNFLTRRFNSIATENCMPPEVISVGEDRIVEELNAHPPDLIVLSERDIADGAFVLTDGNYHYGRKIFAWVIRHYQRRIPAKPGSQLRLSLWIPR